MTAIFLIVSAIMVVSALGVVLAHNPMHSALWLILNLLGVAALYAMLHAHFLAAVQVIVYAGAIMVLVIFVLMLLNVKVEQPRPLSKLSLILSAALGVGFLAMAVPLIRNGFSSFPEQNVGIIGSVHAMGAKLYTDYVFDFEIASVLIMAAIVGAVMVSRRRQQA